MELGVDIAELNVVNMRNVPTTPANYAQRSGRAGRSGQPALVFTYCSSGSPHDQYFFKRPERMVSGEVTTPRLDLTNDDLLRAHIHAIWLAETGISLGTTLKDILDVNGDNPPLTLLPDVVAQAGAERASRIARQRAADVLELTYTAWDLQLFAQDVGWDGPPFVWDEERRFLMRCELDALYFHLYQIEREDVDYIMETFPIVKRKDIAATSDENGENGEYITKRIILEMYDQMAALPVMAVPAPKDEHSTYDMPDVSRWETWLNPPPADPRVAHEE
jgi:hypothetical protein